MQLLTEEPLLQTDAAASAQTAYDLKTPEELAGIVASFAATDQWLDRVRLRADRRWYERLYRGLDYDIWVISWLPGQSTGFHDHGEFAGAFVVATGALEEHRPGEQPLVIEPGQPYAFGLDYAHDVRNESLGPAVSIHAYSPPLTEMNEYELDGSELVLWEHKPDQPERVGQDWRDASSRPEQQPSGQSIENVLSDARARLNRLVPSNAYSAIANSGAILVDIRPEAQRATEGSIPGALLVERNVLEWRFDPASSARLAVASGYAVEVIIFCSEGYTSSLAAASLKDLGLWHATDIVGGFKAWQAAGLPTVVFGQPRLTRQEER